MCLGSAVARGPLPAPAPLGGRAEMDQTHARWPAAGPRDNCRFSSAFGPGRHNLSVPPYGRLLLNAAHLQKAGSEARADLMFGKRVYSTVMLDPGS
jgi:hypothetical protein